MAYIDQIHLPDGITYDITDANAVSTLANQGLSNAQKENARDNIDITAENVPYDDTTSGLTADNVQDAIDELSQSSGASSVAQLEDVQLSNLSDNDLLVYDSNLTGGKLWKNAKKIVTCTKAEFDVWVANNSFPYTDCKYIITDSNNLTMTSADIPYDSTGTDSVKDVLDLLLDRIYPVGSIYMSVTDSTVASVEARFGGTWERISEGKALFGYSTTDTDFQTIGSGGGNKDIDLSHSHTVNSHSHTIDNQSGYTGSVTLSANQSGVQAHGHGFTQPTVDKGKVANGITGGSHTHNMQMNNGVYLQLQSASNYRLPYGTTDAGSSYTVKTSTSHTHDLPDHSHTVSGGTVSNHTGADAKEGHKHSLPKSTGTDNPATNTQLSTTQNILNPYITVYMYKRTA